MTIIPKEVLTKDPQHLLFNFPNIHPVKYTKLSQEYHHWQAVAAAEKTARMFGRYLVPCTLIHWERKLLWENRRIQIGKKAFYALAQDEMTKLEYRKYCEATQQLAVMA